MKKSFPDMIISIVLLAFLTSLAVQVSADSGSVQGISAGITDCLLSYDILSADQQCSKIEIRR